jgi:hypothetical protein
VKDQAAPVPAQRPGRSSRPPGTSLDQLPLAGKSVLIIEDEALIAVGLETCLQKPLVQVLSERGIPVVITTSDEADRDNPL